MISELEVKNHNNETKAWNIQLKVSHLSLYRPIAKLLSQSKGHLVMLCSSLKFSKEDMRISKIAMCSSLCTPITKLSGNLEPLFMEVDGLGEVPQQVMHIAKVATGPSLGCSVLNFNH